MRIVRYIELLSYYYKSGKYFRNLFKQTTNRIYSHNNSGKILDPSDPISRKNSEFKQKATMNVKLIIYMDNKRIIHKDNRVVLIS